MKSLAKMLMLALFLASIGCEDGEPLPQASPAAETVPTPRGQLSHALEALNTPDVDGHAVFYDSRSVVDDIQAGARITADDEREVWRFSIPLDRLEGGDTVDLASPDVNIIVHVKDPGCPPRGEECTMVTLDHHEDDALTISGFAVLQQADDTAGITFQADAEFAMPNGVGGTVSYRGGAVRP